MEGLIRSGLVRVYVLFELAVLGALIFLCGHFESLGSESRWPLPQPMMCKFGLWRRGRLEILLTIKNGCARTTVEGKRKTDFRLQTYDVQYIYEGFLLVTYWGKTPAAMSFTKKRGDLRESKLRTSFAGVERWKA